MELFYMALAWLFIISEYAQRAAQFVRRMNARPTGAHAGGRHRLVAVAEPRFVERWPGCQSHRRRQGMLTMPVTSEQVAA